MHFKSKREFEREDALERETADPYSVSFDALTSNTSKPGHIKMVHRLHADEHDEMMMRFMEEDALRAASLKDPADVGMEHEGDKSKLDMDEVAAALFRNERKVWSQHKPKMPVSSLILKPDQQCTRSRDQLCGEKDF